MKYKILCILIILQSTSCKFCSSWKNIPDEAVYQCYQPKSTQNCSSAVSNVNLTNINKENGTIDVEFDYDPNCEYNLELFYWKNVTNQQECEKQNILRSSPYKYSIYQYCGTSELEITTNISNCTKRGVITLKYLTTRCYYMQLRSNSKIATKSRNVFLEFIPKSFQFNDSELYFKTQFTSDNTIIMEVQHPFIKKQPNIRLLLEYTNETFVFPEQHIIPHTTSDGKVEYKLYNENFSNIIHCDAKKVDKFECRIKKLAEENYTLTFILRNLIQCPNFYGVWKDCASRTIIRYPLSIPDPQSVKSQEEDNTLIWIIFGCVVSIGTLFSIMCIIIYRHKITKKVPSEPQKYSYENKKRIKKILLLYPKDTDIVMNTLKALRKALQAEQFTVYDIYDEDQQNGLNKKNQQWILDKFNETDLTILVRTYCGEILGKNTNYKMLYKKPCWIDDLFPFALTYIKNNNHNYSVVCVGLKKINYSFPFNSSTIYELPYQSEILVKHLRNIDYTLLSCNEWNEFKSICDKMKCSIKDIYYLEEILNIKNIPCDFEPEIVKDNNCIV